MNANTSKLKLTWPALLLGLAFSGMVAAQEAPSACVEQGALAWDNWTKTGAGGSGSPAGEANGDYVRCKACHGWDRRGTEGGYVRRSRTGTRPNTGAGDGDLTSRAIVTGGVTAEQILHAGNGRSYADGSGSWVGISENRNAANTAQHANGYTLGNQHPDFSAGGPNGGDTRLSDEQVNCLVEFLNFEGGDSSAYFANIDTSQNPALYTIVDSADAAAGEAFYADTCEGCHGAPADFALPYLEGDGKFSELAHKATWGIPNISMTRSNLGNPTAQNIADLLLFLQQEGGTGFAMNAGINGNWYGGPDRNFEGFQLEVAAQNDGLVLVTSFYTYDTMGNQIWLFGVGPVDGDTAEVDVFVYDGPTWGAGFNTADANEVPWGTGVFTASSCGSVSMMLSPNAAAQAQGFTDLAYDLVRVTTPAMPCPSVAQN